MPMNRASVGEQLDQGGRTLWGNSLIKGKDSVGEQTA